MNFFAFINQDKESNRKNTKGRIITFLFRIGNYCNGRKILKILFVPHLICYRFFIEWLLGVELPCSTVIGEGLKVYHGQALIVNKNTVIGSNCILRQSTTIGNKSDIDKKCPVIGNNVNIGAHVCIIGDITIGDNVTIGAGSIVTKSIPPNCVVVGNPARIINDSKV